MPRTSIKGQVLADLVAEFIEPLMEVLELAENMDRKLVAQSPNMAFRPGKCMLVGHRIRKVLGWG